MNILQVKIEEIDQITKHIFADRLELAQKSQWSFDQLETFTKYKAVLLKGAYLESSGGAR